MLDAVKRYATRILLIHLALFVLVIFFVAGAARDVQLTARDQAQLQTQDRLQLLAQQTARGLQSHYDSILSDLEVILRDSSAATNPAPATMPVSIVTPPTTQPGRLGRGRGANFAGPLQRLRQPPPSGPMYVGPQQLSDLQRQLKDRVQQLVLVDISKDGMPDEQRVLNVYPVNTLDEANERIQKALPWLQSLTSLDTAAMGSFVIGPPDAQGNPTGYHLVALPTQNVAPVFGGPGGRGQGGRGGPGGNRGRGGQGGPGGGGAGGGASSSTLLAPGENFISVPTRGNQTNQSNGPGRGFGGDFGGRGGAGEFGGPPAGEFGGRGGEFGGPGRGGRGGPQGIPPDQGPGFQGPLGPGGPGAATQPQRQWAVVAVVPIENVREQFLEHLVDDQRHHDVNAILVNDTADILVASNINTIGTNLLTQLPEDVRAKVEPLLLRDGANPIVLDKPFTIGNTTIPPQIVSAARFEMPSGRHWTVIISSSVAEAETIVDSVLHSALVWVTFFSLAVTALLVSTSAFLIKSRVRFERMRHDVLTRELEQARHIQLAWLPDIKTAPQGLDVSAANLPASHISGDFYNWFPLPRAVPASGRNAPPASDHDPNAKIAIVIGDVTGHGMAAAFLMATTQLLVRMTLTRWHDPARCLRDVNTQLCTQGFKGQFVTMLVMILDPLDNTIEVATAGHPAPLLERNGTFESLDLQPQLVLGVDPAEEYRSQSFILEPGASLLLYTDGIIEAETLEGQQFGTERLIDALSNGTPPDPAARIKSVLQAVERFRGKRDLLDDLTLVAIRTTPSPVPASV